jgi:ribosomal protein S12 methylthiotransferase
MRQEVPGIHLRTTFIAGHPGETDADFEELKEFVSSTRFERFGVFPYSHEDDTYAYKHYADDVPDDIKQSRADELMAIQSEISCEINQSKIGKTLKVIIDREEDDYFVGRTEFDSPEVDTEVIVHGKNLKTGEFYQVKITGAEEYDLIGQVNE